MFDYTRAAARKIKKDIDGISLGLNFVTQIFSILYLVYILFFGSGLLAVKISLLVLSSGYFLFFCIATAYSAKKELKRKVRLTFQWSKRLIKVVNLGIIIYGFANAEHTSFSLLLIAFSILSWALDLVIGVISFILTSWLQLFFTGIETDMEEFKKSITAPFTATGNFFKRMAGKEVVEEEPSRTPNQIYLDKMVTKEREEKKANKVQAILNRLENKKEEKEKAKLAKQAAKQEKAEQKLLKKAKKEAQRNPAPDLLDETAVSKDE